MIAIKLSKCGYGSPEHILQWDTVNVMVALEYEKFLVDYEETYITINKETK